MSKILIVDDDRATSTLLQTLFQLEGHSSVACPRPENVLDVVHKESPDLILMDFHLGSVESLDTLRAIRADEVGQNIPVVMTSGMDHSYQCIQAGANEFILKPFKPPDLLGIIKKQLDKKVG